MRVAQINYYDTGSGAALAVQRLHHGLLAAGIDSQFLVAEKRSDDPTVCEITTPFQRRRLHFCQHLSAALLKLQRSTNPLPHSFGCFGCGLGRRLTDFPADILNLHWVNGEMLSLREIAGLASCRRLVWTFHDAWPICGTEHHSRVDGNRRYACGYTSANAEDPGLDWSRRIWEAKRRIWAGMPLHIVTPSRWLAEQVRQSVLFAGCDVTVIPNGIDLEAFVPGDRLTARLSLGLPLDKKLIGFGAVGLNDPNKGGRELSAALSCLSEKSSEYELVVAGRGALPDSVPLRVHSMGMLNPAAQMAYFYRACDVFVLASKQDNLPNMMMEALACGTPGVAFNIGGIPEMLSHQVSGYLARPYAPDDLAAGIGWALTSDGAALARVARQTAMQNFDLRQTAMRYKDLYQRIMA